MKKLRLEIEVEYDDGTMHSKDQEEIEWFEQAVLLNPEDGEGLILHSNCIGDEIGPVKVLRIIE